MSLVEVLVSMALTVALSATILSLMMAGQALGQTGPERIDLQQRARVALQVIGRDLRDGGAGLERGPLSGPLNRYLPSVAPSTDGGITIWKTTSVDAQGMAAIAVAAGASTITLQDSIACPAGHAACGFSPASTVVAFSPGGCRAALRIASVGTDTLQLEQPLSACGLDVDSAVAEGEVRTYRVDPVTRQLVRRDEATGSNAPLLDGVTSMTAAYFADAAAAQPISGTSDAALMRVRRVRITLRLTRVNLLLRIPDLDLVIDVAPRNLQGG